MPIRHLSREVSLENNWGPDLEFREWVYTEELPSIVLVKYIKHVIFIHTYTHVVTLHIIYTATEAGFWTFTKGKGISIGCGKAGTRK
jgi:hypothetical protein